MHGPGGGQPVLGRVLGVEPDLDGVGVGEVDVILDPVQGLAPGALDLPPHQIAADDLLGDPVLDLDAGVHLQEPELLAGGIEQELDRPHVVVVDGSGQGQRRRPQSLAPHLVHRRRRALLDELLVAALDGALPLAQVQGVAVLVGHHLHLDVSGRGQPALGEHRRVAEGSLRLAPGRAHRLGQLVGTRHQAHAPPAPAGRRLDQQRVAHLVGLGRPGRRVVTAQLPAGQGGDPDLFGQALGRQLVAHDGDGLGVGAHPGQPGVEDRPGEPGVLGQEAVPGMHGIGPLGQGGVEQLGLVEVGLGGGRTAERHGHVGQVHVGGMAVRLGEDGHGAQAELAGRVDDAHGDLAPIGHQQGVDGSDGASGAAHRRNTP